MADTKISALSSAAALDGTEVIPLVQGGATVNATVQAIASSIVSKNAQTGTSYTLVASDNGKVVTLSNASAITLTVPSGLGAGFGCTLIQIGAGQVAVTASSTTINSYTSLTHLAGQYAAASLYAYVANTFSLAGQLA